MVNLIGFKVIGETLYKDNIEYYKEYSDSLIDKYQWMRCVNYDGVRSYCHPIHFTVDIQYLDSTIAASKIIPPIPALDESTRKYLRKFNSLSFLTRRSLCLV